MGITATAFLAKYNDGEGWFAFKGGQLDQSETRLELDGANPAADFVVEMSALSDKDFKAVAAKMSEAAKKAYLYNKYPAFFAQFDNGRKYVGDCYDPINNVDVICSSGEGKAMSGLIDDEELRAARGDITIASDQIVDARDRELLAQVDLIENKSRAASLRARLRQPLMNATTLGALAPPR
jgi:hypothetical protein